ncbi:MAG: type II secretion system protein [Candidatus Omnitrophica bacterium]|nr:type II secretion system protein [Candidatus Omnitrophota bacterium]
MFSYKNKKGFTITEVIVSALIIGVLAVGVFSAFFGAHRLLNRGRHRMQAYNFATEALDRLRSNYKYADSQMTLTTTASDADDHLESEIGTILRGGEFLSLINHTLTYDVIDIGAATDGYKQVIVKVHWDEPAF